MKKVFLSAAFILGSFVTFAQESTPSATPKSEQTTQTAQTAETAQTAKTVQDSYTEIKAEDVPEAVKKALAKAYPTAVLGKVLINDKKEYQLQVTVGERVGALYADANGNWLKK